MRAIDSIRLMFDNQSHLISQYNSHCEIKEMSTSAKFKILNVHISNTDIWQLDTNYLKSMPCVTTRLSSRLLDKNCDGILFVYDAHGNEHIVMVELKSGFSTQELELAFKQLIYTYFKLHVISSLCEGYNAQTNTLDFVLACQCFKDKAQEASVWKTITEEQLLGNHIFKTDILPWLIESNIVNIKMKKIGDIVGLHLNKDLQDKFIRIQLVLTDTPMDSNNSVDISF